MQEHKPDNTQQRRKPAQRDFKKIATVILLLEHKQVETEAASLIVPLLPAEDQALAAGLGFCMDSSLKSFWVLG